MGRATVMGWLAEVAFGVEVIMDLGLKGVPAAISGASRGLGFATAKALASEGAHVAICGRDATAIESARVDIAQAGRAVAVEADVSTAQGCERFIAESVRALGGLQVLVVNAGGPTPGRASELEDEHWLAAIELNFLSAVRLVRAALPHLVEREWGRILAITSTAVKQPIQNLAASTAARAAATGFMKNLATDLGPSNITVNCMMPGAIATDRLGSLVGAPRGAKADDPAFDVLAASIPLGRVGTPQEFGDVAAFLCSERASFVSGVSIAIDGGMTGHLY